MILLLNAGVGLLILSLAIFTILARELFAAAIGFITCGLLLTTAGMLSCGRERM